jgi:hypothetical protein
MAKHRVAEDIRDRHNRRVYLFGKVYFFRINYYGKFADQWWRNDI